MEKSYFGYWGKADPEYADDPKWHPHQEGNFQDDGSHELKIPYSDPRELVMDILKQGAGVEVVSPQSLRRIVMENLSEALKKY